MTDASAQNQVSQLSLQRTIPVRLSFTMKQFVVSER
jgi:hypothetical protein